MTEPLTYSDNASDTAMVSSLPQSSATKTDLSHRPWDHSDPFFSAYTRDVLKIVFDCYIGQLLCLVGIPGNVVSCLVFWKQGLTDRINLLLFWLAMADLINLSALQVSKSSCYFSDQVDIHNFDTLVYAKVSYVYFWANFVSGTLIVLMSLDRCLSVVFPLRAASLLTYRPMVAAILLAYLLLLLCYLPAFLAFTVQWAPDPATNRTIASMTITSWFALGSRIPVLIPNYLTLIAKPISFVIVVVCCVITIVRLRHASHKRMQMTGGSVNEGDRGETRITQMLLFLCVVYAVLIIPDISSSIAYNLFPEYFVTKKYNNSFLVVYYVFILTASCLNSTANIFAYVVLSSRFRKTLKELCFCFVLKRKQMR